MFLPVIFGVVMAMTVTPGSAARVVSVLVPLRSDGVFGGPPGSGLKFWSPSGQTVCLGVPPGSGLKFWSPSGQTVCLRGPDGPCYKIAFFHDVTSRVSFREAGQACETDGGELISIRGPEEQRDIEELLQDLRSGAVGGAGGGISDGDFWIGLARLDGALNPELSNTFTSCPQLYTWTDGSPASFRNWYFDEPSCGGESCVVMYHQPKALPGLGGAYLHQWNDDRCNMKHNFICKYQPESHVVKELVETPWGRSTEATAEAPASGGEVRASGSEDVAGASGMLLVYVIIPTIPLLLLILVASGTCCFQMLSRSSPRTKTAPPTQSTLWISSTQKPESMEV
ncbi:hypothetical protein JOQ06_021662 [Pogonophryne albipinna]|uniref:C-type lectin domain-containing protein n=1 Tax=Pogonophryne albipinna TaxID=1090488 RepID=A0AAD6F2B1_9TELE|nr:hypothetical protein JOQ06_021662 [Pogonophryne albipinna]